MGPKRQCPSSVNTHGRIKIRRKKKSLQLRDTQLADEQACKNKISVKPCSDTNIGSSNCCTSNQTFRVIENLAQM